MPYYAVEAEVLSSTIPYDTSWHIFIDGKEVLARKNMDMFLAFDCPKGMHQIQLIYRPKGFKLGCIISGSTILAVILFWCLKVGWNRRSNPKEVHPWHYHMIGQRQ